VILMVAWQWLPFACLIFITSLQSLDRDQMEAAGMDGANALQKFWFLTLPHLGRSIAVGVMIEMIFLMSVFAEIFTTTGGGPGQREHQRRLPDLQAGADELRRRRGLGRRAVRRRAGQHRRGVPDPHVGKNLD
jgi:ABC-type glycerol-3-phosphate transport system permease component